jgi:hypothetical protein
VKLKEEAEANPGQKVRSTFIRRKRRKRLLKKVVKTHLPAPHLNNRSLTSSKKWSNPKLLLINTTKNFRKLHNSSQKQMVCLLITKV